MGVGAEVTIDATLTERGSRYGSYDSCARISQALKAAMVDSPNWQALAADQKESLEMLALKLARILNGDPDYRDHWHDAIGYLRLIEQRLERRAEDDFPLLPVEISPACAVLLAGCQDCEE